MIATGIGKYTILDPAPVEGSDVGNNFFLEYSSMGKSRAEEVNKYLLELNDGVKGSAIVQVRLVFFSCQARPSKTEFDPRFDFKQDLADVLAKDPASLAAYSLIIAVDVNPNSILQLADIAWDNEIPFIKARSCGFYGLLRVQVKELTRKFIIHHLFGH
jgi:amyloid beta precursor protein binding protein 1